MAINSKSTKAEILAAYKEIEKQKKSLESQLKNMPKTNSVISKTSHQATNKITQTKSSALINKDNKQDITQTILSLEKIKNSCGAALSNLSESLITESTQLEKVREEINQEKYELKELHNLEKIIASTIDDLIEKYQLSDRKFAEELSQQKDKSHQEIEELKQAWAKEQETHYRAIKNRDEEYHKTQQRLREEYEYNLDLARDIDEEEYNQEKKCRQEELESTRQTLEKEWSEKEVEIANLEQEYAIAKEKVTAFEEQLSSKIKQAKEEGKAIEAYQAKVKTNLRAKEIEGQAKNYELRIESLEQTIRHQGIRISKLSEQLDTSLKQVQDLAVKAIEGSSNRNSFEAMKAIALEQAKTQTKGK